MTAFFIGTAVKTSNLANHNLMHILVQLNFWAVLLQEWPVYIVAEGRRCAPGCAVITGY
jgi:hypothetical protein